MSNVDTDIKKEKRSNEADEIVVDTDIKKEKRSNEADEIVATDVPKPIKEEDNEPEKAPCQPLVHKPITIKSESDLGIAVQKNSSETSSASCSSDPMTAYDEKKTKGPAVNVKAEATDADDHIPDGFFDDLLQNVEGIVQAATADKADEAAPSIRVKSESSLTQQIVDSASQGDETLKELRHKLLQELEATEAEVRDIKLEPETQKSGKSKKKKEKSKSREKKSRKRERSPSKSPSRHRRNTSVESITQKNVGPPLAFKRIKREEEMPRSSHSQQSSDMQSLEKLTPKTKRDQALLRAATALTAFKKEARPDASQSSSFIYTPTVRKLPSSSSFITQQIYENRSPLHTIKNVSYKFNSNTNRLNLHDWGLKCIPPAAVKIAQLLGIDAYMLHRKLLVTKLPSVVKKIKNEIIADEETIDQPRSVLYTNAMTQTDSTFYSHGGRQKTLDVAVQTRRPTQSSIASQTTQSESSHGALPAQMPLASMLQQFNEYQVLALNDFAELLREPGNLAGDIYQLRQRLLDIYKTASAQPAIVQPTTQPPSHHSIPDAYIQQQIQTVGTRTRTLDPRLRNESVYNNHHRQQSNLHHVIPNIPEPVPHRAHGPASSHSTHSQTNYYTNR